MTADWNKLKEQHEIAMLHGDLATSSPQSYSPDEKRSICEEMETSTEEIDAALRADFWAMPAEARSRMLDLLGAPGVPAHDRPPNGRGGVEQPSADEARAHLAVVRVAQGNLEDGDVPHERLREPGVPLV